jgi:hypothetical protein
MRRTIDHITIPQLAEIVGGSIHTVRRAVDRLLGNDVPRAGGHAGGTRLVPVGMVGCVREELARRAAGIRRPGGRGRTPRHRAARTLVRLEEAAARGDATAQGMLQLLATGGDGGKP